MTGARQATRGTAGVQECVPIVERWHLPDENAWHVYARAYDKAFAFASAADVAAGRRQVAAHRAGVAALEDAGITLDLTAPEPA